MAGAGFLGHAVVVETDAEASADPLVRPRVPTESLRRRRDPPRLDDRVVREEHPDRIASRRGLPLEIGRRFTQDPLDALMLEDDARGKTRDDGLRGAGLAADED